MNSPKIRHLKYEALRRSLQATVTEWPYIYEHKIIGKNGKNFLDSIGDFEKLFPQMNRKGSNLSKNGSYLSLTYELRANDVDEIISLWVASEEVKDFVTVL